MVTLLIKLKMSPNPNSLYLLACHIRKIRKIILDGSLVHLSLVSKSSRLPLWQKRCCVRGKYSFKLEADIVLINVPQALK